MRRNLKTTSKDHPVFYNNIYLYHLFSLKHEIVLLKNSLAKNIYNSSLCVTCWKEGWRYWRSLLKTLTPFDLCSLLQHQLCLWVWRLLTHFQINNSGCGSQSHKYSSTVEDDIENLCWPQQAEPPSHRVFTVKSS